MDDGADGEVGREMAVEPDLGSHLGPDLLHVKVPVPGLEGGILHSESLALLLSQLAEFVLDDGSVVVSQGKEKLHDRGGRFGHHSVLQCHVSVALEAGEVGQLGSKLQHRLQEPDGPARGSSLGEIDFLARLLIVDALQGGRGLGAGGGDRNVGPVLERCGEAGV